MSVPVRVLLSRVTESATTRRQPRPQRRRTRSVYVVDDIPRLQIGRDERVRAVFDALVDDATLDSLAESCSCLALLDATDQHEGKQTRLTPSEFAAIDPLRLAEVRRAANYKGRTNQIRFQLIKRRVPFHVAGASQNELEHMWDALRGRPDRALVTQMVRLSWRHGSLDLRHDPDLLVFTDAGERVLLDVTSYERPPLDVLLQWELTARFAESVGWTYEVRHPMTAQRAFNLRALDQWADPPRRYVALAERIEEWLPANGCSMQRIRTTFRGPVAPLHATEHLIQNGRLHLPLGPPIIGPTWITREPAFEQRPDIMTRPEIADLVDMTRRVSEGQGLRARLNAGVGRAVFGRTS